MGASRKLQGEIDRVLKKVQEGVDVFDSIWNKVYDTDNANQKEKFEADLKKEIKKLQRYRDQIKTWIQSSEIKDKKALLESRKQIEREMERFKVCEKETKTKAFSKEGLVQQPKTDPKEKAKSETRDWLNNVVGELESQIDNFEAELEGLFVKKGKTRPPRLTHLETSIVRHKAHIMKLELILRLLDNDELSPDQVNDVRDFLDDYVERNQEQFDEFSDVDELYSSLPLDKVESLEDLVAIGTPALVVKGVSPISTGSAVLSLKTSVATSPTHSSATLPSTAQQVSSVPDQVEETASQDSNSDSAPRTPPSKSGVMGSSVSSVSSAVGSVPTGSSTTVATPTRNLAGGSTASAILSGPGYIRGVMENAPAAVSSTLANLSSSVQEDDGSSFPGRRSSPALPEIGVGKGIGRGSVVGGLSSPVSGVPLNLTSGNGLPSNGALGTAPVVLDMAKRNLLGADERIGNGAQPLVSPLSNRMLLQQVSKTMDGTGSTDSNNSGEGATAGRAFSPSVVSGVQWRPQSPSSFQNQNEMGQFRARTEIAPDQREKFLQRLQQVQQQQQGHSNLLGVSHLPGANHKQFPTQQQFNSQSSSLSPQVGLGLGVQSSVGLTAVTSSSLQQQSAIHQQSAQHVLMSAGPRDADAAQVKIEDQQQQHNSSDDVNTELATNPELNKILMNEDDLKTSYMAGGTGSSKDAAQVPRDTDLSPRQPLPFNQSSADLGVIGRRSVPDLGAIGDNLSQSTVNNGLMQERLYSLQMLDAAYHRLPQSKDSERAKNYTPRHPTKTPASFPQVQAPIVDNPAFWERLSLDSVGTDILFFAFYYQQNTYQQYLAARELKKQSWRYHRKYSTWFQRHEEPKVTTDEYEQGTYVYFDFHIANDDLNHGWCQRIKTEFTFEYSYLEDELLV
ncbi:general negative regulator of transcription subunit 3-like protein isoform X3 [Cinnamomum micranthum f. kanehirae]|uniref:General negative regulator of transcription subunit 3-like protein isoform X3 n=1 Tax=Cinnamomum micranthum f. kanehirae TaxID=337451 RepID=A0A3S3MLF3_9MAGN|nr:general negative regulator of transcription subunit 3-like protein isoform X3 [Cinnamomum micranthum f. kanehirae]